MDEETASSCLSVRLPLFQGFGIELEYAIVSKETLDIMPIADRLLFQVANAYASEVELGDISWSNELALHVIELKTTGPSKHLKGLEARFQDHITKMISLLDPMGATLMPTAMHPWMDPYKEMYLWPHEHNQTYESFNRIFDCRGHGWVNLQSIHINLPFSNDEEFAKLHAAIRVLLPIIPALAASSPIIESKKSGFLDKRLDVYRNNAKAIPSVSGKVIPEVVYSQKDYEQKIFSKIYNDIAPYDPKKILQHEWLNARGAIARFQRSTIEIRIIDIQECPLADLAIAHAVVAVLQALVNEKWGNIYQQNQQNIDDLHSIFLQCMKEGEHAEINNSEYLSLFKYPASHCTASRLWHHLIDQTIGQGDIPLDISQALELILSQGTLASRILKAWSPDNSSKRLREIYRNLCECLASGTMFSCLN